MNFRGHDGRSADQINKPPIFSAILCDLLISTKYSNEAQYMKRRKSSGYKSFFAFFFKKPPHWAKHPICVLMQLRLKEQFLITCKPFLGMGPQEALWLLLFSWHRPVERIVKISKIRLNGKCHFRTINWKLDQPYFFNIFAKLKAW